MLTRQDIQSAHRVIADRVRLTPVVRASGAQLGVAASEVVLKLECLQHTGSFKARGAFTNLLTRTVPPAGVVAASGGNHGAAVAYAARELGVRATIFVPSVSSHAKIDRIRSYGAELVVGRRPLRRRARGKRAMGAAVRSTADPRLRSARDACGAGNRRARAGGAGTAARHRARRSRRRRSRCGNCVLVRRRQRA